MSPFGILLKLRMMKWLGLGADVPIKAATLLKWNRRMLEVVVTTGAIRHAKLQSNHHYQRSSFLQAICPSGF